MNFIPSIGLEIHAQIITASKMFCSCPIDYSAPPNTLICPICLGYPGSLPTVNKRAVEVAVKVALALQFKINKISRFARKNYFYPDLPKGYQITQFDEPLAEDGLLEMEIGNKVLFIKLPRLHLEEDAGKLHHSEEEGCSFIDFNRCGIPLIEIVTEPTLSSPHEASVFLKNLRDILLYLEVSPCNMEEGNLRCDANISLSPEGSDRMGVKVEVKNLNSFKFLERALHFEIERQSKILRDGGRVKHETRLYDERLDMTIPMRTKEVAVDYRYFPEPDLNPLVIDREFIDRCRKELVELPKDRIRRLIKVYGLPDYDVRIIVSDKYLADFFEDCANIYNGYKNLSNWIIGDLLRELNSLGKGVRELPITPSTFIELLKMVDSDEISIKTAKEIFPEILREGISPRQIVIDRGLAQINRREEISDMIESVLKEKEREVQQYLKGKKGIFGFFVGEVLKRSKGRMNPRLVNELLLEKLESLSNSLQKKVDQ